MTLAALAAFFIAPAQAQQIIPWQVVCQPDRDSMLKMLEGYTPQERWLGLDGKFMFELHKTKDNEVVVTFTQPDGVTCGMISGEGWRQIHAVNMTPKIDA